MFLDFIRFRHYELDIFRFYIIAHVFIIVLLVLLFSNPHRISFIANYVCNNSFGESLECAAVRKALRVPHA